MTLSRTENSPGSVELRIGGIPNEKQQQFFDSRTRYTAYGGARGGGKSWALRRKLIALCLRYPGIHCLLIRRSYPELKSNHVIPMLREYGALLEYNEKDKQLSLSCGSRIDLGYCSCDRDALRYQGQEYDIIAVDEATQLSEYQFSVLKACLRGVGDYPRRFYLTCNPGGVGHAWVKRLFIDRAYRESERAEDYSFIQALVYDNGILRRSDPEYITQLESLPGRLRDAWLLGRWDVFEGQFFPEFDESLHVFGAGGHAFDSVIPNNTRRFVALDYGFDMLAALLIAIDRRGDLWVLEERCIPGLTLGEAAEVVADMCRSDAWGDEEAAEYAVASPDLWNRRQDSGRSGVEIMQSNPGMPPMRPADNRRIPGWRVLREYLAAGTRRAAGERGGEGLNGGVCGGEKREGEISGVALHISKRCTELINSMQSLMCDSGRAEDAAGEPHAVTHAPEALRYAVMSRAAPPAERGGQFSFKRGTNIYNI